MSPSVSTITKNNIKNKERPHPALHKCLGVQCNDESYPDESVFELLC
jgi:hypothetical protein